MIEERTRADLMCDMLQDARRLIGGVWELNGGYIPQVEELDMLHALEICAEAIKLIKNHYGAQPT